MEKGPLKTYSPHSTAWSNQHKDYEEGRVGAWNPIIGKKAEKRRYPFPLLPFSPKKRITA